MLFREGGGILYDLIKSKCMFCNTELNRRVSVALIHIKASTITIAEFSRKFIKNTLQVKQLL